jgi:micrococcal nuclease
VTRSTTVRSGASGRARHGRALFALRWAVAALALLAAPLWAQAPWAPVELPPSCVSPDEHHGTARVAHVFDGDTVRLADDTRVRLIGLDTPEFHHRDPDRDAEPLAREAREALESLLAAHGYQVILVYDRERHDRYRRTLAHLFTPDGQSITALMLVQGHATRLTIPPNEWHLDCFRDAERSAAATRLGIWSLPDYRLYDAPDLPRNAEGFRRVEGRVVRIGESARSVWVNLEGDVALRIDHADMHHFPGLDVRALEDRRVRARGYVYNHRGQPRIRLRHPADLEVMEP